MDDGPGRRAPLRQRAFAKALAESRRGYRHCRAPRPSISVGASIRGAAPRRVGVGAIRRRLGEPPHSAARAAPLSPDAGRAPPRRPKDVELFREVRHRARELAPSRQLSRRAQRGHRSPNFADQYSVSICLATSAAHDFGYVSLEEFAQRLDDSLGTIERLERHEGHILNWYDTTTLTPLEPRYVSTVDSGNLAAHLWTLRQKPARRRATLPFSGSSPSKRRIDAVALSARSSSPRWA